MSELNCQIKINLFQIPKTEMNIIVTRYLFFLESRNRIVNPIKMQLILNPREDNPRSYFACIPIKGFKTRMPLDSKAILRLYFETAKYRKETPSPARIKEVIRTT